MTPADRRQIEYHIREARCTSDTKPDYLPLVLSACRDHPLLPWFPTGPPPAVIGAMMSRESGCGLLLSPPGPGGTGDGGHGRGLMQIDDRYHSEWIALGLWDKPCCNIRYGVEVLHHQWQNLLRATELTDWQLLRAAVAAYNAGPLRVLRALKRGRDPDTVTTGRNYSWDVWERMEVFKGERW